jgi:hypothetical protein
MAPRTFSRLGCPLVLMGVQKMSPGSRAQLEVDKTLQLNFSLLVRVVWFLDNILNAGLQSPLLIVDDL